MSNEDTVKAAAHKMCAHFLKKQIKVPHTLMLEAIAEGFGLDCWRELKAVIDAPRAQPKLVLVEGQEQEWSVDAIYLDNDQQYGDTMYARTALEAAVFVQIERKTEFCQVGILNVEDENGENILSPSFAAEVETSTPRKALESLRTAVATWPMRDLTVKQLRAFDWLNELLYDQEQEEAKNGQGKKDSFDFLEENPHHPAVTEESSEGATPSQALLILCDAVESNPIFKGNVANMERGSEELAKGIYHVRALTEYFTDSVNSNLEEPDLEPTPLAD